MKMTSQQTRVFLMIRIEHECLIWIIDADHDLNILLTDPPDE